MKGRVRGLSGFRRERAGYGWSFCGRPEVEREDGMQVIQRQGPRG